MMVSNVVGQGGSICNGMMDLMMFGVVNWYEVLIGYLIIFGCNMLESVYCDLIGLIGEIFVYGIDSWCFLEIFIYDYWDFWMIF